MPSASALCPRAVRGFRVVCETEKRKSGNAARRRRVRVVFPAPLGDERMRRMKSERGAAVMR